MAELKNRTSSSVHDGAAPLCDARQERRLDLFQEGPADNPDRRFACQIDRRPFYIFVGLAHIDPGFPVRVETSAATFDFWQGHGFLIRPRGLGADRRKQDVGLSRGRDGDDNDAARAFFCALW